QDPFRVIPSIMVGSMVGSVIAMLSNVGDRVAHGGPIVGVLGAVDNVVMFFVAIIIGSIVTALMIRLVKKDVDEPINEDLASEDVKHDEKSNADTSDPIEEINKLTDITNTQLIDTNLSGETRDEIIDEMIDKLDITSVLTSKEDFRESILERESQSSTGIGMNVAIPHGKSDAVKEPRVVFGIKKDG